MEKTALNWSKLNDLVSSMEDKLNHSEVDEKLKCEIMMNISNIVTECIKNPPTFEVGFQISEHCKPYAIKFADLSDDFLLKMMSKMFLE